MLFGGGQVHGEEAWIRVTSPHFEVISDATPERARGVAVHLERFRRVLAAVLQRAPAAADLPTVVLAFRDQDSLAPYRPLYRGRHVDVEGYFQAADDHDDIAASMDSNEASPYQTVCHEYAHVLLNRTLSAQPVWLAEGLAEVLSRWTAVGEDTALVGLPAPDHLRRLGRDKLLPLPTILGLDDSSPLYNEGNQRGTFYAESWAVAHWAVFGRGPTGPADLQAFLAAIAAGTGPERAFTSAFGAAPDTAERLLPAYIASPLPVPRFEVAGLDADVTVETRAASRGEVEYRLGDLLLHGGRLADARRHLERAVESDPGSARAHAALGQLAVKQARWAEARHEIELALAADPGDAVALFRYADLIARETASRNEVLSGEREEEVVAALERAVALAPPLGDACELLARLRPDPVDRRIAQVRAALARDPTRADLGLTLASLYARANDLASARATLVRTRALARDDVNRFLSDHLLARLDQFTAGTAEVAGTLVGLECLPSGTLRFVVTAAGAPVRLEAPSATSVFLYGRDGAPVERTFTCGAQRDPVVARYRPAPRAGREADGTLLSLTFEAGPAAR